MTSSLASLADRMTRAGEGLRDFPDHANVLAIVSAYQDATGTGMPWSLLLTVMREAQTPDRPFRFVPEGAGLISVTVRQIVADLRALDLVWVGPDGTRVTTTGREQCTAAGVWFQRLQDAAAHGLGDAGFVPARVSR